jgi:hypothetical protein
MPQGDVLMRLLVLQANPRSLRLRQSIRKRMI